MDTEAPLVKARAAYVEALAALAVHKGHSPRSEAGLAQVAWTTMYQHLQGQALVAFQGGARDFRWRSLGLGSPHHLAMRCSGYSACLAITSSLFTE
jgi:hypothetical protein